MPKYFDRSGNEVALESLQIGAEASGMELDEYISEFGFTSEEGKQTDLKDTTPPTGPQLPPAGDSSSGDISLESPEPSLKERTLKSLQAIKLTPEEILSIEEAANAEPTSVMQSTAAYGDMSGTPRIGGQTSSSKLVYPYDEFADTAKSTIAKEQGISYNDVKEEDWREYAKSLYIDSQKRAIIDERIKNVMEDYEDESLDFVEWSAKGLKDLVKFYGKTKGSNSLYSLVSAALTTDAEIEMEKGKQEIIAEYKNISENNKKQQDALVENLNAAEAILGSMDADINRLAEQYKENPAALTESQYKEYQSLVDTRNAVAKKAKEDWDTLSSLPDNATEVSEVIDMVGRTYDNREVALNRIESTILNIDAGLFSVAKELTVDQLSDRIAGTKEYIPKYLRLGEGIEAVADNLYSQAEEIDARTRKRQSFTGINDAGDLLDFSVDLFSEQLVNTAITSALPGAGLYLVAASSGGQKFHEMDIEIENGKNISAAQFYATGILYGAGEYVTEKVALDQFTSAAKGVKKAFDLDGVTQLSNIYMTAPKAVMKWGLSANEEGFAELGSQLISNFADKHILGKDISLTQGLSESYLSGAFMSGVGFNAPVLAVDLHRAISTSSEIKAAQARSKEIIGIKNRLDELNLDKNPSKEKISAKAELQKRIDDLALQNVMAMNRNAARLDELSRQDKRALLDIDAKAYTLRSEIDKVNGNTQLTATDKKSLIEEKAKELDQLEEQKSAIFGDAENSAAKSSARKFQIITAAEKGLDFNFVNGKDANEAVNKAIKIVEDSNLSEADKAKLKEEIESARDEEGMNGFYIGAEYGLPISLTTDEGAKRNSSVIAHEVSHATLFKKMFEGNADALGLVSDLESYMRKRFKNSQERFDAVDRTYRPALTKYYKNELLSKDPEIVSAAKNKIEREIAEEKLAAIVEYTRQYNIELDQTIQGKLLSKWNKLIPNNKEVTEIRTGKDVLNAIISFNSSFDKGELTGLAGKLIQGKVTVKAQENIDIANKEIKNVAKKSISKEAERAKQVMDKVSANMDFFDPNSPLIARVLPGMIQAQLASLSNKGLQFDMEEAISDVILRLYSAGDIAKFDGRGTLYGYVNGRIGFRIKDMLKGSEGIVEDFNQSDVEDLKGAAADVTTVEQIEERTEAERPQYKKLLERKVVTEETLSAIVEKIPRIVGTLKNRIDEPVSKNKTVTPLVNELRLALGKQIDIDLKKEMGGKKDGQLRKWLTSNKKALLENMTTTYLMQAMPIAVQKKVNGVWTSDWKGKKIDRETVDTDKAGRTSGAELVRRLPQASIKIDDRTFLSFILEESGNPIRGKKESWAKAIAEELAIEIVDQEMKNPDSRIYQAFVANQERLEAELIDNWVTKLSLDFERGNVKFSKGYSAAEMRDPKVRSAFAALKNIWSGLSGDSIVKTDLKDEEKDALKPEVIDKIKQTSDLDVSKVDFVKLYHTFEGLESDGILKLIENGRIQNLIANSELPIFTESFAKEYKSLNAIKKAAKQNDEKAKSELEQFIEEVSEVLSGISPKVIEAFGGIKVFGGGLIQERMSSKTTMPARSPLSNEILKNVSFYTTKSGIVSKIKKLQQGKSTAAEIVKSGLIKEIQKANIANKQLSMHVASELVKATKEGRLSITNLIRLLQDMNAREQQMGKGFRALGQLMYFSNGVSGKQKIEHVYPNLHIVWDIVSLAADDSFRNFDAETKHAIEKIFDKNTLWSTDENITNFIDIIGNTSKAGIGRLSSFSQEAQNNIFSTIEKPLSFEDYLKNKAPLQTLKEHLENEEIRSIYSQKIGIKWSKVSSLSNSLKPSVKFSMTKPQAIFMVGGAGSGKSSVIKNLGLVDKGYRLINQDPYLEQYIKEAGLPTDESTYDKEQRSIRAKLGWKARKAAEQDLADNTATKESMIVDGTGGSYKATTKKMKALEDAGFEIHMIFVNTSKKVASARNAGRAERSLPDFVVKKNWDQVQESAKQYREDYAGRFYELNTDNLKYGEALPQNFVDQVNNGLESSRVKFSKTLDTQFNEMIERVKGVSAEKVYTSVQARMMGEKKGKYRVFVPASADDFRGLTSYTFAGKGKQGEADQKFFEENLINPYVRGVAQIDAVKQQIRREYHAVAKANKQYFKMLGKKISNTDYTYDQALRVYMWTQQGIEVPGMNKDDISFLVNEIMQFPGMIELGNAMQAISRQDTWIDPSPHWMAHTLVSELNSMTEKVGRQKYLQEFIENAEVIFSKENLNKIEAIYGTRHREALEDALYAMKNGRNRPAGTSKQVNQWLNWVNNSTGAIMFFNIRSAVLQTLSATNFINWSDNNPVKAAAAFANQKQYWSDFSMIFNSDKLKQRRSGLQTDVNEAEIANQADGAQNKASAVIAYLLKIGFTPTQIADSFAISMGGASFYRNRVNTYLKQGLAQAEAETKAFEDFSKTADEAQQSSDPYLVSQEQRSVLGRLVLAFQNTPMQYTRLMKKAMLDLANGRGDAKTHISKIIYYGAVQNLVFSALQSALFTLIPGFDDEDEELSEKDLEKKERANDAKYLRIVNSMTDSILKGSGVKGAALATIKNTITEYFKQEEKGFTADHAYTLGAALSLSPPIGSKYRKIYAAIQTKKFDKDVLEARGFSVMADGRLNLSPAYSIIGSLASGAANVPLDRMVEIIGAYSEALDSRNTAWQRIALALGWKTWDVGAKNEEHDLIKAEGKAKRKEEGKKKAAETRKEKRGTRSDREARALERRKRNK